jgi:hypothetical protein
LEDYSGLEPTGDGGGRLIYVKQSDILASYDQVLLDPIEIWFHPNASYRGINPDELNILTDYFEEAIVNALNKPRQGVGGKLSEGYPVVDAPGPNVLRARAAITGLTLERPQRGIGGKTGATFLQMKLRDSAAGTITGIETAMEAELLDAQTGERLIAIVDRRSGDVAGPRPGIAPWEYAKNALDYWAEQLRRAMDKAHGAVIK